MYAITHTQSLAPLHLSHTTHTTQTQLYTPTLHPHTHYTHTLHHLHQGAKREDSQGLCPSGGEACLQTKENSEKRTNAGEEQDLRAEADRSGVQDPL